MVYIKKPKDFHHNFEIVSCFIEYDRHILLLQRWPHKSQGNKWGNPAGKVEKNEDLTSAMIREIKEETGLNNSSDELNFLNTTFIEYPDVKFVYHLFKLILNTKPEININPYEHQEFKWVKPEEALKMNLVLEQDYYVSMYINNY